METNYLVYYFTGINIAGFGLALLFGRLSQEKGRGAEALLMLLAFLGASPGIVAYFLLLDRKAKKQNMMTRIFAICILVIQVILFLALRGYHGGRLNLSLIHFFDRHRIFGIYLLMVNFVTFVVFAVDKRRAIKNQSRVRIVTLLGLAFLGGSLGALLAMHTLRHKTRKIYFTAGIPLILVMQIVVLLYVMNI